MARIRRFNELKRIVLGVLEWRGWVSAPNIRRLSGWIPGRKINVHLERYTKWGWLKRRGRWNAKPVYYRITPKGIAKLRWLRENMP